MDRIQIKTKVEKDEYVKLMMQLTYKRPVTLFISFIGLVMLIFGLTNITGILVTTDSSPIIGLAFGAMAVFVIPFMTYRANKKAFTANSRLQEEITYSFEKDQMVIEGESFTSTLSWDKVYQVKELPDWILLYQTKQAMNLLPKRAFNPQQLNFFTSTVYNVPTIKKKFKRER